MSQPDQEVDVCVSQTEGRATIKLGDCAESSHMGGANGGRQMWWRKRKVVSWDGNGEWFLVSSLWVSSRSI